MKDGIVEEVRKARKELFAEFDNDLQKVASHYIDAQSQNENTNVRRKSIVLHLEERLERAEPE
jgi:hypothetical protein